MQALQIKKEVLDSTTVCHMCRHLVTRYFVLSADDLALWDAEPESFATDEAGESWKYSLRVSDALKYLCTPGTSSFQELFFGEFIKYSVCSIQLYILCFFL